MVAEMPSWEIMKDSGLHFIQYPSPNFGARRGGVRPDMVILHYTGMESAEAAAGRLCDPCAEVSAHYLLDMDGTVFAMVPEDQRAWHAGVSSWGAVSDVNSRSIGIELANPGHFHGYPPFPEPQMAALSRLLQGILERWSIPPERVLGHSCIAPGRKIDPGEKFDWRRLAAEGLAIWADEPRAPGRSADGAADAARFREAARRFGYRAEGAEGWDADLLSVWRSFLMRFRPGETGAAPHAAGVRHLERLAAEYPVAIEAESIEPAGKST